MLFTWCFMTSAATGWCPLTTLPASRIGSVGLWKAQCGQLVQNPHKFNDRLWIGYADEDSLKINMNWIRSPGNTGAMTWAIGMDDFHNLCGRGTHSLMGVIYENMKDCLVPMHPPIPTTTQKVWPSSTTEGTTRNKITRDPNVVSKPVDRRQIDCSEKSYWPHSQSHKIKIMI